MQPNKNDTAWPWPKECAWCGKAMNEDSRAFAISVQLRPEAFVEVKPGTVEKFLLPRSDRQVPAIILPDNSPGKRLGKDALFQLCSQPCAEALRHGLTLEIDTDSVS